MRKCLILDDFVILFFLIRFILDIIWLHCHRLTLVECYFISTILLLVTDLQIRPFFVCWMALLVWCWICFNIYAPYMKYEENWWVVMMHTIDVLFICFWARMSLTDFFRRLWSEDALLIHIVVGWNLMVIQPTTWMRFFMDSVEYFLLLRFEIVLESTDRWNTKELSFILAHFAGAFFYFFQSEIYQRKRRFGLNKLFT